MVVYWILKTRKNRSSATDSFSYHLDGDRPLTILTIFVAPSAPANWAPVPASRTLAVIEDHDEPWSESWWRHSSPLLLIQFLGKPYCATCWNDVFWGAGKPGNPKRKPILRKETHRSLSSIFFFFFRRSCSFEARRCARCCCCSYSRTEARQEKLKLFEETFSWVLLITFSCLVTAPALAPAVVTQPAPGNERMSNFFFLPLSSPSLLLQVSSPLS